MCDLKKEMLSFEQARDLVSHLFREGIITSLHPMIGMEDKSYKKYAREHPEDGLPSTPYVTYRNKGWIGFDNFVDKNVIRLC